MQKLIFDQGKDNSFSKGQIVVGDSELLLQMLTSIRDQQLKEIVIHFVPLLSLKFVIQAYRCLSKQGKLSIFGEYKSAEAVLKAAGFFESKANQFSKEKPKIQKVTLIDQDDLLDPIAVPQKAAENCSTKSKACAGCSCGRKELQEKYGKQEALKKLAEGEISSKCGNCFLGDAFRCSSCPYKGLPAFKKGDEVDLQIKEGKIKLQI